jgi:hypothetical protein
MVELESLRRITHELAMDLREEEIRADTSHSVFTLKTLQVVLDNLDELAAIVNTKDETILINKKFKEDLERLGFKYKMYDKWYTLIGFKEKPLYNPINKAVQTRDIIIEEWISPQTNKKYRTVCIPLIYNGVSAVLALAKRI